VIRGNLHDILELVDSHFSALFMSGKLRWAFNPNFGAWELFRFINSGKSDSQFKPIDLQYVINHDIALFFWMDDLLVPDKKATWLSIKLNLAKMIDALGPVEKKLAWGVITYRPEQLRNARGQVEQHAKEIKQREEQKSDNWQSSMP
jgi:hypothetical protein